MKTLKLAAIPMALVATSAFAEDVVAVQQTPVAVTMTTYDANAGLIKNTTTQVLDSTKTIVGTVIHPGAVSAEVGTLGYGANVAWGVNDKTELVAGWNGGKTSSNIDIDSNDSYINWRKVLGNDYRDFHGNLDYKVKLNNPYLGLNMRPFSNYFTVGTGVIFQKNSAEATMTPTAGSLTLTIDKKDYPVVTGESVHVKVEPRNSLAPYLTVGLRPNVTEHFGLFAEAGAAYMGKTTVKAHDNKGNTALEQAVTSSLNGKNVWWPIAKVGATYRF